MICNFLFFFCIYYCIYISYNIIPLLDHLINKSKTHTLTKKNKTNTHKPNLSKKKHAEVSPSTATKNKPQNAVFYSDRPCYPANDSDALVPLSTTENVIMDSIDALMAYTTQAQRISAWNRNSKKTMIAIMKSLRYVRVAWTSIECRLMIVSTMFDGQQNVYIGSINRQYDSNIEQPFNTAYLRVGEMTDLSICGVNFEIVTKFKRLILRL